MSERRACRVIDADRKSVRYRSTRDDDADLREKLRELANQRRRFGYRRLHILLRREGIMINRKKTQRLYKEEGLAVRRRRSRRRAVGTRAPAPVLALPNQRWSLDFAHDQMASGRRFRVLNVVDDVTRECLAAVPDTSISGRRVVRVLAELIAERGKPGMIVSDNGTELTSNAVLGWWRGAGCGKGITSRQASLCRTASIVACATNCSMRSDAHTWPSSIRRDGTVLQNWSCRRTSPYFRCQRDALSSTRPKICGNSCAITGSRTASSNPPTTSSTTAASPRTISLAIHGTS